MFFLSKPDSIDLLCGKQSIEEEIHTCAVSMWCLEQAKALKACRFLSVLVVKSQSRYPLRASGLVAPAPSIAWYTPSSPS